MCTRLRTKALSAVLLFLPVPLFAGGRAKPHTVGIGAGADCDGQVLVLHDILKLTFAQPAKFVRQYGDAAALISNAVTAFKHDVEAGAYPSDEESYHLPKDTKAAFETIAARKRAMR